MSDVCVVTGGGSGMGLSAALQMQKDKIIIPIPAMNERKSMTLQVCPDRYLLRI